MIVRISGEDQFRVDGAHEARLTDLDNAVLEALERGDEAAFDDSFEKLLDFVRSTGTPLAEDELEASDVILPPADTTIDEAANDFTGEGWLPD
jgi:hypothetical protein